MSCFLWGVLWLLIIVVSCFLLYLLLLIASSCLVNSKRTYDKHSGYFRWLLNSSTGLAFFIARIHLHTKGMDKIPEGRFLLVCNHRSKFDPITTWYMFRDYELAFISKEENFHVPFWGRIIRKCCFLPIDRENPRKAMETINKAAELIKNDEVSMAVYPEGTRNYGDGLLPFHSGVFKIAQKANVPVVICGIKGADQIRRNFPLHRSDVFFEVLDVIPAEKAKSTRCNDISDYARELMLSYIEQRPEEENRYDYARTVQ